MGRPVCLSRLNRRLQRDSAGVASPSNGFPFGCKLRVQLGGLKDSDEHDDVTSPGADDLDSPACRHCREDWILTSSAVAHIPKQVATRGRACPSFIVTPRWVGVFSCDTTIWHVWREVRAGSAAKLPGAYHENRQWLDIH